jgi:hypothetical protein
MTRFGLPSGILGMELTFLHLLKLTCFNMLYRASDLCSFFERTLFAVMNTVMNMTLEVLVAAAMKIIVISEMMQYRFVYRYQHFGGMCCLHPLGRQAMFSHSKYYANIDAKAFENLQRKCSY